MPLSPNLPTTTSRWCPEEEASWFGRLLFTYVNSLVAKGRRKALEPEDLWSTAHWDEAGRVAGAFQQQLERTKDPAAAPQVQGWLQQGCQAVFMLYSLSVCCHTYVNHCSTWLYVVCGLCAAATGAFMADMVHQFSWRQAISCLRVCTRRSHTQTAVLCLVACRALYGRPSCGAMAASLLLLGWSSCCMTWFSLHSLPYWRL